MADDLQTYLLLGKQAQGKAVVSLIRQVLAAPSIYTFTELLMLDAVKALEATEDAAYLTLLRLFSYGTYEQFSSSKSALPELGPAEVYKLKKLSLISLASQSHNLSYAVLMHQLDLGSTRELEDLVIDSIYSFLIKAKLNTRTQSVYVESTAGRDLGPADTVGKLIASLRSWQDNCDVVLSEVQENIDQIRRQSHARQLAKADHARAIEEVKSKAQPISGPESSNRRTKRSAGYSSLREDIIMDEEHLQTCSGWQTTVGSIFADGFASPGNRKRKTITRGRR